VETILVGLMSFMTEEDGGDNAEKWRALARKSKSWNSLNSETFAREFPEVHALNLKSEEFFDEERSMMERRERKAEYVEVEGTPNLMDVSFESHVNVDWEKFGSMDEEESWEDTEGEEEDADEEEKDTDEEEKDTDEDVEEGA
jgi:hypothetical protein